jgi:hypothetical protein
MGSAILTFLPLVGLVLSAGVVLMAQDWRLSFPALLVNYISLAFLVAQQQALVPNLMVETSIFTVVAVKLVTGVAVTLILTLTALTFSRDYGLEDLDEFGLSELRRAARAAQYQQTDEPLQFSNYSIPFWSLLLALAASLTLPRIYPLAISYSADFAWYWLGLTGLFTLVTANDLLKIGMGLLLSVSSMDLLYTVVISTPGASGIGVVPLLLLSIISILLALAVAYLSGLLYGRLKTLELGELYKQVRA